MPTYLFRDNNTGVEWTESMGISAADEYLAANPHIERLVNGAPLYATGLIGKQRPDGWFVDKLNAIKREHKGHTIGQNTMDW